MQKVEKHGFLTFYDSTLPDKRALLLDVLLNPLYSVPVLILLTLMDTEMLYTTSSLKEALSYGTLISKSILLFILSVFLKSKHFSMRSK